MIGNIGILGGTFDPIHYGHLFIAENALRSFGLDKIIFIPAGTPPHKQLVCSTDKAHRLAMTELAVKGNNRFEVSDMEVSRDEVSYTVDTAARLMAAYPGECLHYIVGADSLSEMTGWKNFRKLLKMVDIISINRMTGKFIDIEEVADAIRERYGARIHTLEAPIIAISSTEIRRRVREGLPVKYMLPDGVLRYIKKHKLYL